MSTAQKNPLALVTGASSGIGLEIAKDLKRRGHDLVIVGSSHRINQAAVTLSGLGHREDGLVVPVQADLTTRDGVENAWRAVEALGEPLDVAVLNAGMGVGGAAFKDTDLDEELTMIQLNVTSQVHLAKRVVQHMAAHRRGRILFTSSVSATTPTPYEPVYGPTRAFIWSFANGLREELRGSGVTVTCLLPGATDSEFHARAGMGKTRFGDNSWKNSRGDVARQGVEALLKGRHHVVGGNRSTKFAGLVNKILPESVKAFKQGRAARPR